MEIICETSSWLNSGCNEIINLLVRQHLHSFSKLENLGPLATCFVQANSPLRDHMGNPLPHLGYDSGTVSLIIAGPLSGTTNTLCCGEWVPRLVHKLKTLFL